MENDLPKRVRVNLWISMMTYKYLEYVSLRDNRTMSDVIREALRDHASKDAEGKKIIEKIDLNLVGASNG